MSTVGKASYQFALRMPDNLRDKIRETANENMRSINSEIVFQLERIFSKSSETEKADVQA
ncbi:Arc family DNA-binding protein [Rhizobium herbae]|uniref:Arc-like DNA binding domain-containing protein n=1 Tax=Rhizobium herbae TaxID=508661 RepID=A0ABS4EPC2_9HYPH|nr:Arc family DNA-binding protein [Rhizobium herbae]MBP1859790.1 hypothetical protein [Rhizobium herbae]